MIKILEQTIKALKLNLKPYDLSMLTRKKVIFAPKIKITFFLCIQEKQNF